MEAKKIEIKILFLSLTTLVLIETAAILSISGIKISPMVVTGVARLIETALIIIIIFVWGQGLTSIGLVPSEMVKGLKRGLFWSAGFGIITFFAFIALFLVDINPLALIHTRLPGKSGEIVLFFSGCRNNRACCRRDSFSRDNLRVFQKMGCLGSPNPE